MSGKKNLISSFVKMETQKFTGSDKESTGSQAFRGISEHALGLFQTFKTIMEGKLTTHNVEHQVLKNKKIFAVTLRFDLKKVEI